MGKREKESSFKELVLSYNVLRVLNLNDDQTGKSYKEGSGAGEIVQWFKCTYSM